MERCWLKCQSCSRRVSLDRLTGRCDCGGTLLVEYDMDQVKRKFTKESLRGAPFTMWRYADLLPVADRGSIVSLGEGWTPLIRIAQAERKLPVRQIWMKREEQNPTGSFKARGLSSAVSLQHEKRVKRLAVPSNGNAASALAAYAARAGMRATVLMPMDCPVMIQEECVLYGADTYLVDGYIHDAGAIIEEGCAEQGWVNVGTLKEPGRVEGKKTMGLELAEQFDWQLPDTIIYPTGGGSGIIGMWKAFCELAELGLIQEPLPRLISVQEAGCQPLVDAIAGGRAHVEPQRGEVHSGATGLRVPQPPDGDLLLNIIRETGGTAVAVSSESITAAQRQLGRFGISSSPEGASTWAALEQLCESGEIDRQERVVLFNTSHAMKYMSLPKISRIPMIKNYAELKALQQEQAEIQ